MSIIELIIRIENDFNLKIPQEYLSLSYIKRYKFIKEYIMDGDVKNED